MDSFDLRLEPVEALEQLQCLVDDISNVWTVDKTRRPRSFPALGQLSISEVGVTSVKQPLTHETMQTLH